MTDQYSQVAIYIAPDIRNQTIQQFEEHLVQVRAARMLRAQHYKQTKADKTRTLVGQELLSWHKECEGFERDMEIFRKLVERMDGRIKKLVRYHDTIEAGTELLHSWGKSLFANLDDEQTND